MRKFTIIVCILLAVFMAFTSPMQLTVYADSDWYTDRSYTLPGLKMPSNWYDNAQIDYDGNRWTYDFNHVYRNGVPIFSKNPSQSIVELEVTYVGVIRFTVVDYAVSPRLYIYYECDNNANCTSSTTPYAKKYMNKFGYYLLNNKIYSPADQFLYDVPTILPPPPESRVEAGTPAAYQVSADGSYIILGVRWTSTAFCCRGEFEGTTYYAVNGSAPGRPGITRFVSDEYRNPRFTALVDGRIVGIIQGGWSPPRARVWMQHKNSNSIWDITGEGDSGSTTYLTEGYAIQYFDHYSRTGTSSYYVGQKFLTPRPPLWVRGERHAGGVNLHWWPVPQTLKYKVFRDGVFIGETTNASFSDHIVISDDHVYSYTVTTVNKGGESVASPPFIVQRIPVVAILSPSPDQILSAAQTLAPRIRVSDPDNDPLTASYYVNGETNPRQTVTVSNTATAQEISFDALDVRGWPEGVHTLRFAVSDGRETAQETVAVRMDVTGPHIQSVTAEPSSDRIDIGVSAVDSVSGLHEAPYRYTVGQHVSNWTSSPTYTAGQLLPNTLYPVKLEARDKAGNIAASERQVYTYAQVPALSVSRTSEHTAELLAADRNPQHTRYLILQGEQYVNSSGLLTPTPEWITLANKTVVVRGLAPNTAYPFRMKAMNDARQETAYSAAVAATTWAVPPPPSEITHASGQRWIRLNWPESPNATGYEVEADGAVVYSGPSNTFTHSGLSPNTGHTYRIRVVNGGGAGNWSSPVMLFTLPDPPPIPGNLIATALQTEITVSWDIVAGAEGYEVEADDVIYRVGNANTFTLRELKPSTAHTFRVRAGNAGGVSEWSPPVIRQTLPYPPDAPTQLTAIQTNRSVTLSWSPSDGATSYELEADGLIMDIGAATSYVHDRLEPLSGHTYRVRAVNAGGRSPWSAPLDITTHPDEPAAPGNVMTTSGTDSVTVTWYQVEHADVYEVEIDGQIADTVTANLFTHSDVQPDSAHTYRIRAKNVTGYGPWSAPVTMRTLPESSDPDVSLTNIAAVVTNTFITISWDTVAPGALYDIEVDGVLKDNGNQTIFHHGGLNASESHTYRIRVKDTEQAGDWVAVLSLSTLPDPPSAPVGLEAFATHNSIELKWDIVEGASGYDVEIDGQTVANPGNNSAYTHADLTPGTSHTYRVRARNITGVTAWSPAIVKSTTSPAYHITGVRDQDIHLSLIAANVQDFSDLRFVVTYDPDELQVKDLCGFTPGPDTMGSGRIPGTHLDVVYTPGKLVFSYNGNVAPGTSWSGELTSVVFTSLIDGQVSVEVVTE